MPIVNKHFGLDTDTTLSNNSDTAIASQKAIKSYVDNGLATKQNTVSDLVYIRTQVDKVDDKISSIDVTDSGSSLPSVSDYNLNDTFINKTDKKLYKVIAPDYELNSNVTVENPVVIDFETGIASGFTAPSGAGGDAGSGITRSDAAPGWSGQVQYNIHFKLTSLPSGSNYYNLFYLYGTYKFDFMISSTGFYVRYAYSYMGPTSYGDYVELFNFSDWQINKEYFITINKDSDGTVNTSLREISYSGNILSQGITSYNYATGTNIGYGRRNGYYGTGSSFTIGQIYLADSTGNFLVPAGFLIWDSGTTLEDNTQYNDITNKKTLYYNHNILYESGSNEIIWGNITGDIEDQTDLQNALNSKANDNAVVKKTDKNIANGVAGLDSNTKISSSILPTTVELNTNKVTSISSSSTDTQYPSAKAVNTALSEKQNTLVSGTNIKTINSQSILGNGNIEIGGSVAIDNNTITKNTNNELQTVGIKDIRTNNTLKTWTGTKAQYDAIMIKDNNTLYNITDDTDITITLLETIYPVGSIYITTNATCPLQVLFGTWQLVGADRVLQGAGTRGAVGTMVNESLPNIKGSFNTRGFVNSGNWCVHHSEGAFKLGDGWSSDMLASGTNGGTWNQISFNASRSSSTYQDNAPVQQDAYLVNIFRRIS